jgi:hypothetical protein
MAVRLYFVVIACFVAVFLPACGGSGFKVLKNPAPDAEGFLTKDMLQVSAVGFPSRDSSKLTPQQRQREAYQAAEIQSRMRVVDFLMTELQNENSEMYQNVVVKIGGRLPVERYEDPHYSAELQHGGQRADAYFELFSISGFAHTNTYNESTGRCSMLYRVVKADFVVHGKNGFGISRQK